VWCLNIAILDIACPCCFRPNLEYVLEQLQHMRLQQHSITPPLGDYKINKVVPSNSTGKPSVTGVTGPDDEDEDETRERSIYLDQSCSTVGSVSEGYQSGDSHSP
jgi:hypothetical protein